MLAYWALFTFFTLGAIVDVRNPPDLRRARPFWFFGGCGVVLGVILLLFSLGLEFSLRKLLQIGPTAGLVALAQSSGMVWIGYTLGQMFGWTTLESVYAGAVIAISSTTIIAKAFEEQHVKGKFTDIVLGVLIIEDLIGIFLIAILTTVSAGTASRNDNPSSWEKCQVAVVYMPSGKTIAQFSTP